MHTPEELSGSLESVSPIKHAQTTFALDTDALAYKMQSLVFKGLQHLPHVELAVEPEPMISLSNDRLSAGKVLADETPKTREQYDELTVVSMGHGHLATVKIHHDRLGEGLAKTIKRYLDGIRKENGLEKHIFDYEIQKHDDGTKIIINFDIEATGIVVGNLLKRPDEKRYQIEGINDPNDIPTTTQEMLKTFFIDTIGTDVATGATVIDGQKLLGILQGYVSRNVKEGNGYVSDQERNYQRLEQLIKIIPGSDIKRDGNQVTIKMDMKAINMVSKQMTEAALSQVQGVTLAHEENQEDPTTTTARIDFKQLTDQAIHVARDQLHGRNGIRIHHTMDTALVSFNSDLQKADIQNTNVADALSKAVQAVGMEVANSAVKSKPPTVIQSIKDHFLLQSPQMPDIEIG